MKKAIKMIKLWPLLIVICLITGFTYSSSPTTSAESAILIDSTTGRVMYSLNPYLKKPMASTTKIMTALLAIQYGDLDSKVKIKKSAVGVEGSSIYLSLDEEILLKDLVYGLMLRSGNDAAVAIAEHISGSEEEFVKLMNKKAKEIGAYNTSFTNPHGLNHSSHYSTAYDMAIITRAAMELDFFREVSKTKNWVADREINQYFSNKNDVVWEYKGGDGVKIGFTKVSGRCLVASATRNEIQLIAVVLNDGNWFNDCYRMLDFGFDNYKPSLLLSKGQFLKKIQILDSDTDYINALCEKDIIIPLMENEQEKIKYVINLPDTLKVPIVKDQKLGNIQIFLEGQLIYTVDIKSNTEVKEIASKFKIINFFKNILN